MRLTPEQIAVIDEFGELGRQVAAFQPIADRHKALKEQITSWFDERAPADQSGVLEGKLYQVQVSARAMVRRIVDMGKLFTRLGKARFLESCTFPLSAVDRLLPCEADKLVRGERTGPRVVKAVSKVALSRKPERTCAA